MRKIYLFLLLLIPSMLICQWQRGIMTQQNTTARRVWFVNANDTLIIQRYSWQGTPLDTVNLGGTRAHTQTIPTIIGLQDTLDTKERILSFTSPFSRSLDTISMTSPLGSSWDSLRWSWVDKANTFTRANTFDSTVNRIFFKRVNQVYCIGNSLTANGEYESFLEGLLGDNWNVKNLGIGSNSTTMQNARFTNQIINSLDAQYVIIWGGIIDVKIPEISATIDTNLQQMYTAAHNAGIKVVAVTITPYKGHTAWTTGGQAILDSVNTWITTTAIDVDYIIDANTILADPAKPDSLLAAYASADWEHLSTAGYDTLAANIYRGVTWTGNTTYPILKMSMNDVALNQNLRIADSPIFKDLSLSGMAYFGLPDAYYTIDGTTGERINRSSGASGIDTVEAWANYLGDKRIYFLYDATNVIYKIANRNHTDILTLHEGTGLLTVGSAAINGLTSITTTGSGSTESKLMLRNNATAASTGVGIILLNSTSASTTTNGLTKINAIRQADGSNNFTLLNAPGAGGVPVINFGMDGSSKSTYLGLTGDTTSKFTITNTLLPYIWIGRNSREQTKATIDSVGNITANGFLAPSGSSWDSLRWAWADKANIFNYGQTITNTGLSANLLTGQNKDGTEKFNTDSTGMTTIRALLLNSGATTLSGTGLNVYGSIWAGAIYSVNSSFINTRYNSTIALPVAFTLRAAGGRQESPTALTSGTAMGTIDFQGIDRPLGTTFYTGTAIRAYAEEDWSSTSRGTGIRFLTVINGATSLATRWRITNDGHFVAGAPSAGDNTYDIGAVSANRPRTGYFATSVVSPLGSFTTLSLGSASSTTALIYAKNNAIFPNLYEGYNSNGILIFKDDSLGARHGEAIYGADSIQSGAKGSAVYTYIPPGGDPVKSSSSKIKNIDSLFNPDLSKFKDVKPYHFRFKKAVFLEEFDENSIPDSIDVKIDSVTRRVSNKEYKDKMRIDFYYRNDLEAERRAQQKHVSLMADEFGTLLGRTDAKELDNAEVMATMWLMIQRLESEIDSLKTKLKK